MTVNLVLASPSMVITCYFTNIHRILVKVEQRFFHRQMTLGHIRLLTASCEGVRLRVETGESVCALRHCLFKQISGITFTNPHFLFACRLVLRYSREGKGKRVEEMTMDLPKDPMMLYSVVNTKLRDYYGSLEEMCDDMNLSEKELEQTLAAAGFEYNRELNKFM